MDAITSITVTRLHDVPSKWTPSCK